MGDEPGGGAAGAPGGLRRDITYGTNHEIAFDYLRDNLALVPEEVVHRGFSYAIVDEVDFLLIDEARTPLIISGPAREDQGLFDRVEPGDLQPAATGYTTSWSPRPARPA